jgi:hypothetical protein
VTNPKLFLGNSVPLKRKKSPTPVSPEWGFEVLGVFKFLGGWPGHGPYRFYLVSGG